jgi:hypothetical protein
MSVTELPTATVDVEHDSLTKTPQRVLTKTRHAVMDTLEDITFGSVC